MAKYLFYLLAISFYLLAQPKEVSLKKALKYKSSLKEIDLSGLNLETIPSELYEFSKLESINLSDNKLTSLPDSFKLFAYLKKLDLSKNKIKKVNSSSLPDSLIEINLNNNLLTYFSSNRNLEVCGLSYNLLEADSTKLGARIKIIDLSHNNLDRVPRINSAIEKLDLNSCNLETFEFDERYSSKLSWLNLGNNFFDGIPSAVPTSLTYLDISSNRIVNSSVSKLYRKLKSIDLSFNYLESFDHTMYPVVQSVFLNNNFISDISLDLFFNDNVVTLNLSSNQIRSFGESSSIPTHSDSSSIKILYLRDNYLDSIPNLFCYLGNLREIDLAGNGLESLPQDFVKLEKLRKINLDNNHFSNIPDEILWLEKIEYLSANNNPINEIPIDLIKHRSLKDLFLYNTLIKHSILRRYDNLNIKLKIRY